MSSPRSLAAPLIAIALALGPGADASPVSAPPTFRRSPANVGNDDATAVAVESERVAVGDGRGVLVADEGRGFRRVLARGPVRDLVFLDAGRVLAATDRGLYRIDADGRGEDVTPGPGESARAVTRIAAADGLVAVATGDGAFIADAGGPWQRVSRALPSGAATAIALRAASEGFECWTAVGGQLQTTHLRRDAGVLAAVSLAREALPFVPRRGGPVDVALSLPGADAVVVFESALAVRRAPGAGWAVHQPQLPPGASAVRLAAGLGRLWLATDRGLLVADDLAGPWRRAPAPAGSAAVRALASSAGHLYAATDRGLVEARAEAVAPTGRGLSLASLFEWEPKVFEVQRAALRYLELSPERMERLRRGVDRRGWLPLATFRTVRRDDRTEAVDDDQSFLSGAVRHLHDRDRRRDRDFELSLTFTWDLGDLAYHPEAIDVSRETREVIKLRDDVLDEVNQLYFERQRVLAELAAAPDETGALRLRLRADELAAGLDGWTGGWFTRRLAGTRP